MYICIEGNIGAGKTTLAKSLAKKRASLYLPERFDENILLPLFYKHRKKLAFLLEYSFLIERHAQLARHFQENTQKETIADYSLYKCLWFAKVNLSEKDYRFFKKHFGVIEKELPRPDLIVYLRTSRKNLVQNIKKRGRDFEAGIREEYLDAVSRAYDKGMLKLRGLNVLTIDVAHYNAASQRKIISEIEKNIAALRK